MSWIFIMHFFLNRILKECTFAPELFYSLLKYLILIWYICLKRIYIPHQIRMVRGGECFNEMCRVIKRWGGGVKMLLICLCSNLENWWYIHMYFRFCLRLFFTLYFGINFWPKHIPMYIFYFDQASCSP